MITLLMAMMLQGTPLTDMTADQCDRYIQGAFAKDTPLDKGLTRELVSHFNPVTHACFGVIGFRQDIDGNTTGEAQLVFKVGEESEVAQYSYYDGEVQDCEVAHVQCASKDAYDAAVQKLIAGE